MLEAGACLAPGYHVLAHLRRGTLVDVYDCWSLTRRCRCVAKIVRPDRATDTRTARRLLREGRLLRRLEHPHIVRAYDVLRHPQPTLVLETLTGATLSHVLQQWPRGLEPADVAILGLQLCSALHYLHASGILHLDLKPSNIIADAGSAKVIDLDIARAPGPGRGEGTRQYMAPEQIRRAELSCTTDVWGLGVVLFEALTRRSPFQFDATTTYPQLEMHALNVRRYRRAAPVELTSIIDAALEPDPAARPTVDEIATALAALVEGAPAWQTAQSPGRGGRALRTDSAC